MTCLIRGFQIPNLTTDEINEIGYRNTQNARSYYKLSEY